MPELTCVGDLKPSPYNPRYITPAAMSGLSASMAEFGDLSGIVWNAHTGHLVAGHQRMDALRVKYGDGLRLDSGAVVTPDGERWPVRVVDWDAAREKAANMTANNPAIAGTFTPDAAPILAEIKAQLPEIHAAIRLDAICAPTLPVERREDDCTEGGESRGDVLHCPHCAGKINV